jgi:hypothetical protein
MNGLQKIGAIAGLLTIISLSGGGVVKFWETFVVDKSVKLVFEPQVTLEELPQPPGPPLRFYNFRFMVRNSGKTTADKFYYKFVFPSETVIPTDQRFGKGDRSLWLDSNQRVVPFEGKTYYSLGGIYTSPIFSGRSMNVGNLSLMEPLKDFNVQWQLTWEGGTYPEDSTTLGVMTMEKGQLKVTPSSN